MKRILLAVILAIVLLSSCGMAKASDYKKIAVIAGSVYDKIVWANFPDASVVYCNTPSDAILMLKTGKADAYLDDEPLLQKAIVHEGNLKILSPPVCRNDYGIAVNKNNPALREQLNAFIAEIKADGTYDEIYERWIKTEVPPDMPEIKGGKNGVLKFGTSGDVDGFTYYKNAELTGFDVELAKRFAAYMEMELEIQVMDFGALVPAINTNKIDFAAAVITITDERRETIGFSDPYFSLDGALCVPGDGENASAAGFFKALEESFIRNLIVENRWKMIASGLRTTLIISGLAFILGTLLGALVCWLMTRKSIWPCAVGKAYVTLLSSTPVVILLMVIYYVVFAKIDINTIVVAVIAYGLNASAYIGTLFCRAVLSVDKGQIEAARSMGFDKIETFFAVTLPQAASTALPAYKFELSSLIKSTSVVGYIAVIDLTKAADIIRGRTYDAFFPLLLVTLIYLLLTGAIVLLFAAIDRLTNKKSRKSRYFAKPRLK